MMTRGNAELKARQTTDYAWTGWKDKNVLKKNLLLSPLVAITDISGSRCAKNIFFMCIFSYNLISSFKPLPQKSYFFIFFLRS